MSAVDALGSTNTVTSAVPNGYSALGTEQFVKIILTELSRQDPLKPNDTSALLQQLSDVRAIQSDIDLSDRLKQLVGQGEMSAAAGMIGKGISGISEQGERVNGVVKSVSKTEDGTVLTLENGIRVAMKNVDEIGIASQGAAA